MLRNQQSQRPLAVPATGRVTGTPEGGATKNNRHAPKPSETKAHRNIHALPTPQPPPHTPASSMDMQPPHTDAIQLKTLLSAKQAVLTSALNHPHACHDRPTHSQHPLHHPLTCIQHGQAASAHRSHRAGAVAFRDVALHPYDVGEGLLRWHDGGQGTLRKLSVTQFTTPWGRKVQ